MFLGNGEEAAKTTMVSNEATDVTGIEKKEADDLPRDPFRNVQETRLHPVGSSKEALGELVQVGQIGRGHLSEGTDC